MKHLKRAAAAPTKNTMNGHPFDESFFDEKRRAERYANIKNEIPAVADCELALVPARMACLEFCKSSLTKITVADLGPGSRWHLERKFTEFNQRYERDQRRIAIPFYRRYNELYAQQQREDALLQAAPKWISPSQPATLANFGLLPLPPQSTKKRGGKRR
jgi:hypothetical protein